jgi:hypothetical protein
MVSDEQAKQIKSQLIDQINSSFPEDKKAASISQIENMNNNELKDFLIKNKLIKTDGTSEEGQCIFCSIAQGKIPSVKIGENSKSVAALEINPVSYGHAIIIPKEHTEDASKDALELAKDISEKIKILKPKKVDIFSFICFFSFCF